ncbi:MAG: hypothetical protein HQK52_17045 [Oligoflexia bacterium]|nr:hypothetical protein [Oligoflexia bacterium]
MKRDKFNFFVLLFCSIASVASFSAAFAASAVSAEVVEAGKLGAGIDLINGEAKNVCIEINKQELIGRGINESYYYQMMDIVDYGQLASMLNISAIDNLKIGIAQNYSEIDLSQKERRFNEVKIGGDFKYFMIHMSAMAPWNAVMDAQIKEEYLGLLTKGPDGVKAFREKCGDEYVVQNRTGMSLSYLIEVSMTNSEDKSYFEKNIRPKMQQGKDVSSIRAMLKELSMEKNVRVLTFLDGDFIDSQDANKYIDELDRFQGYIHNLATTKNDVGDYGVLNDSLTHKYLFLDNFPMGVDLVKTHDEVFMMGILSRDRDEMLKDVSRAEALLKKSVTLEQRAEIESIYNQDKINLKIIAKRAQECFADLKKCQYPEESDGYKKKRLPLYLGF